MKMRKGYSAIALLILCASCRLPPDATQWRQLPPGATVLVEPPPNPRVELVWSEAMIASWLIPPELQIDETKTPFKFDEKKFHDWLKGSPTGNAQNCMPQLVHWLDPSGTFQTRERNHSASILYLGRSNTPTPHAGKTGLSSTFILKRTLYTYTGNGYTIFT